MRIALIGAVESSLVALEALAAQPLATVAAVVTLPTTKAGVHADWVDLRPAAEAHAIPVIETADANDAATLAAVGGARPDHLLVVGWSRICRPPLLRLAGRGVIGYHPALLPRNRGRAVIPWTILQDSAETGGSLFWMDEGVDTGDILLQRRFPVAPDETARSLYDKHMEVLAQMIAQAIPLLAGNAPPRLAQDDTMASYCSRRTADDAHIDWSAPARAVWTLVRACGDPYPGAFTFRRGRRMVVCEASHEGPGPFWGLPGQVQALVPEGALVQCGDREHVLVRTVAFDGEAPRPAASVLKTHERLGPDLVAMAGSGLGGG